MEEINARILLWYMKGFNAKRKKVCMTPPDGILEHAFNIGRNHVRLKGGTKNIVRLTDDEILHIIHEEWARRINNSPF